MEVYYEIFVSVSVTLEAKCHVMGEWSPVMF